MTLKLVATKLQKHVVPFLKLHNKAVNFFGSGFIYNHKETLYLISASHVYDEIKKTKSAIQIGVPNKIVTINDKYGTIRTIGDAKDGHSCSVDLMATKIQQDNNDYELLKSISINNFFDAGSTYNGSLLLQGYPESKNKQPKILNRNTNNFEAVSSSITVELITVDYSSYNKDEQFHIAMKIQNKNEDGNARHSLEGMSGGPVWFIPENNIPPFVVGIFTDYKKNDALGFATRFQYIDELIRD
ncbi:hypothetical protein [uncultured Tolumonas sp.]|uniref:hypothetical protein n=1 Tax=uncultured Tolumonas sp. TaxID=263765 RepID=UPI00292EC520|nr:hypothetical protein [uncultured Tolumonas sp.]